MENTLFRILLKMFFKIEIFEKHTLFIGGVNEPYNEPLFFDKNNIYYIFLNS